MPLVIGGPYKGGFFGGAGIEVSATGNLVDSPQGTIPADFTVRAGGGEDYTTIAAGISGLQSAYDGTRDWILEVQSDTPGTTQIFIDDWLHFTTHASANARLIVRAKVGDTILLRGSSSSSSGNTAIQLRDYCTVEGDFLADGDNYFPDGTHQNAKVNWFHRQDAACTGGIIKDARCRYTRKSPISDNFEPATLMYYNVELTFSGDWYNPNPPFTPADPDHGESVLYTNDLGSSTAFVQCRIGSLTEPSGGHSSWDAEEGYRHIVHDCKLSNDWTGYGREVGGVIDKPAGWSYPYWGNRAGPATDWEGTEEFFIAHNMSCYSMPAADNEYTGFGRIGGTNNTYIFNSKIYGPHGDGGTAAYRFTSGEGIDGVRISNETQYYIGGIALGFGPPWGTSLNYPKFRNFKIYNSIFLDLWNDSTYDQLGGYSGRTTIWATLQNASQYLQDPMPWYDRIEIRNCIVPTGFRLAVTGNGESFDTTIYYFTADELNNHFSGNFSGIIEVGNANASDVLVNPNITKSRLYDDDLFAADFAPKGVALGTVGSPAATAVTQLSSAASSDTLNVKDAAWFRDNRGHDTTYLPYQRVEVEGVGQRNVIGVNIGAGTITVDSSVTASINTNIWLVDKNGKTAYSIGAVQ